MRRLALLPLVAVLALVVAVPALAEEPPKEVRAAWQNMQPDITIEDHLGNPITGVRCATVDFGPAENPRAPEDLDAWIREHALEKLNVTIPVAVHVLYYLKGSTYLGNVTDTQIANQIAALNARLAALAPSLKRLLPAHNTATADPGNQIVHYGNSDGNGSPDNEHDHTEKKSSGIRRQKPLPRRYAGGKQNDSRCLRKGSKQRNPPKKREAQF